ncbi:hypothetical protein V9L05_16265 [Bernardetia sp. Wsw4-3y2]|uniref:hypothetical protein n=1 Tax=unclassified Bernardetia TaxID=2647129 RepID=UPI0030CE5899
MKKSTFNPDKHKFLTIDFYIQGFFFALTLIFGFLSCINGYFVILGLFGLIPIALYNSVGLTYHILQGSYSKEVERFRKIHAISAVVYLITFILIFLVFDNPANTNKITLIIFWAIPPFFLIAYFFITWQDWKAMKNLNN